MGKLDIKIKAPDPNGAIDNVFGGIEKKVDDRAKKSINNINNTLGKYENEVSNLINGIQIKNNKIQKIDLSDYLQLDASGLYKNAQKQTEIKRDVNKVIEYIVTETNKTFERSVKSTGKISNDAFNELISNITVSDDEIDKLLKVSGNNNIDKTIAKKALQAQKLIEQLESNIGISWGKNGFDTTKIGTGLGFDLDAIENEINSLVSLGKTYTGLLGLVKNSNLKLSGYSTNKLNMRSNALQSSSEAGGKYWNEILTNMAKGALNPVSEFINSDHSDVGKTSQARDKLISRFGSIFEESFKNMTRDAKEFDLELDTITEKLNTLSKSALSGNRNKWTTKAKEDFSGFLASYIAKGGNVDTDEFKTWSGIRDSLFNTKITPRNKTNIENYKAIYGGVLQYYEKQAQAAKDVVESEKQVQDAVGQSGEAVVNANNKKIKSQEEYRAEAEKLYKLRLEAYKDRETENLKFKEVDYSKYPEYDKGRQKTYFSEDGRYKAIKSYGQKAYDIFEKFGDTYGMYALTFSKTLKNAWQDINRSHNVESHILSDDKEHSINRIIEELIKNDEELAKEAERKKKLAEELREATQEEKDALLSEYPEAVVKKYQSNIEYARKVINSDLKFKRDKDDKRLYKTKDDLFEAYKNLDGTYSLLGYGDSYDSSTLSDLSRDILRIHQNIANDDLSIVKMKEHLDLLLDGYNEVKRLRAEGKNVDSPFDEFEKEAEEKRKAEEKAAEANKKSGLPSKADEKLRVKNERELAKAQSDAKKQSDQYGKNTANDLKQLLEKENTSIVNSFNSKKEQLKDALRKYYSDATGDPSILNELKKNVSNLFTEAFKILNNPSLTGDQTANLQESLFDDMSDIAEKKFRNLFSESSSNIDKFEKQLLNLGYASDEVNEKISSLKVSLAGVEPGSNFINAFDPFKKWNDDFEKDKRDTINKMANTWLGENQTNRFENIKFLLGGDGALNGAIADINKLDEKLREGAISTAKYESEYEKLQKKWSNAIASFSYNPSENRDAMKQWVNMQAQGAAVTLKWSKDGQQLTGVFRNQNNELVKVVATADQFKGTVKGVVQEIRPMKSGIEAFFDSIGSKWQEVMRYMATYVSLRSVWTEFQKGINVVREYDKALTEMNKVSDASMYTLQAFQKESFGIADSVGVTASVVQNSTADWLRLGESFAQAKESAKASAILYNVSEFQDIGSATDALVSASQAYQELSKTDIIDKINYIGNNYSIATDGLASALQRSAAVLKTQGNNLDQAIALITAGNSIIQNPEMVAAGIRTISLRIAGTEAAKNQLVEAGEDVDDFIIQTKSKTQQLIKNYTAVASNSYKGVDVLDDNGNLRSTYDILLDISKVYKEIQKTDKAAGTNRANALVEALAGKVLPEFIEI